MYTMYMNGKTIFTPTEARQNFFAILRLVEKGNNAIIIKKNSGERFIFTRLPKKKVEKNKNMAEALGNIGFKSMPIKKMKKIILTMHDIKIK